MQTATRWTHRKLVQNHLKPILKITRGFVSTKGKTGTRNMHIGHVPRDAAISKPDTSSRRQMSVATSMASSRKEKISITRTRERIPFSKEVPTDRMVNSTGRSNQSIIFLRSRMGVRKIITGGGDETVILLRGRIRIGKIIPIRRVGIHSADQRITINRGGQRVSLEIRCIITNIKSSRHSEK
jgi:hypothetical protein